MLIASSDSRLLFPLLVDGEIFLGDQQSLREKINKFTWV